MDILAKLFNSGAKVKLMRLFLFNPDAHFTIKDISERSKVTTREAKKEADVLISLGIIKKRSIQTKRKGGDTGYILDTKFPYLQALKNLLITVSLHADDKLVKKFAKVGRLKFFLASGVFLQQWDSRVDLLVVGDGLNLAGIEKVISAIEAEIGKEISYSAFETEDFLYRLGIHDRLVRDILDFPHTALVNRLGIEP
jgi:hypothetical protein